MKNDHVYPIFQTILAAVGLPDYPICAQEGCNHGAAADSEYCPGCRDDHAEAAYERSLGECFRGGEAAAYHVDEQARIQRELK